MNSKYKKVFSDNLKQYMSICGKSQADIIADLGFDKSTVSTWYNGLRLPRMDKIDALAKYFGVNRSDFFEDGILMSSLSELEIEIIRQFRIADKYDQMTVLRTLKVNSCTGATGRFSDV